MIKTPPYFLGANTISQTNTTNKVQDTNISNQGKSNKKQYNDPLNQWPVRGLAYSNEIGAAISEIAPKAGLLLWIPALLYFGADIYDKYKNDKDHYKPSGKRAIKRAIFQGLTSLIALPVLIFAAQCLVSPIARIGKFKISGNAKDTIYRHTKNVIDQARPSSLTSYENFEDIIIKTLKNTIESRNNEKKTIGYVIAVPHVYPQNFPLLDTETPRDQRQARFFQALLDEVKKRNTAQLPVVLMAHLSIEGSDRSGHDESIGGIEYVPLSAMGEGYDYLALGHIHCPQDIKGSHHHARYCGTPLPVSFDETYPHSVSIIELEKGAEPQISTREIENPIPLVTLPHDPTPFEDALKLLEEYPEEKPAYLRLNVLTKGYLPPDCNEKASNAAKGKACKYCYIKTTRERQADTNGNKHISIQEMQEMSPLEIARLYYRETEGEEMDTELCQLMETVVQKVKSKNNS